MAKLLPHLRTPNNLKFVMLNGIPLNPYSSLGTHKYLIEKCETQSNEVYLISYPKCGQHIMKKICIEIVHHHDKENTHKLYSTGDIGMDPIPLKEMFFEQNDKDAIKKRVDSLKDTFNVWCTHNPYSVFPANKNLLHPDTKYIVINRHPKDVLISYWHFLNNLSDHWSGFHPSLPLNDFLSRFISGTLYYGCYYQWTLDWFNAYNNDIFNKNGQMLWIYYEDILNEPFNIINTVKDFLYRNDEIVTNDDLTNIIDLIKFDKMKQDNIANPQSFGYGDIFFRTGKSNDWINYLSQQQSDLLDEIMWIKWAHNGTDIKYYAEIMEKYASNYDFGYHSHTEH